MDDKLIKVALAG